MSLLAIMGSGETAPTMTRTHRRILERTGPGAAVMLDTTFGFQDNADDLVAKTQTYFQATVGRDVEVASWRRADGDMLDRERALALLRRARWAFAGPGSPSYALRQWHGTALVPAILDVATRGGAIVVGSAAACTIGSHSIPVYEIYKAGADLYWDEGLDLLGSLTGLRAAVVPHFDNHEGGTYDTRYCYLGAERLTRMEAMLGDGAGVLGVDEHTAVVLDLQARTAEVAGNGVMTIRAGGRATEFEAGTTVAFADLASLLSGAAAPLVTVSAVARTAPAGSGAPAVEGDSSTDPSGGSLSGSLGDSRADSGADASTGTSLRATADLMATRFDEAVAAADADGAVTAVLDLDTAIVEWSRDSLQSDDADHAHQRLRVMVVELGRLAETGMAGPGEAVGPLVVALLDVRTRARAGKDFATSDLVRDSLVAAGIEVRDTAEGVVWHFRGGQTG